MKKLFSFTIFILSGLVSKAHAEAFNKNNCDAVLVHAGRNVMSASGSEYVTANKYSRHCDKAFESYNETQIYELEVEVFGYGGGSGDASIDRRKTKLREWCSTSKDTYEKVKNNMQFSSLVYGESVKAWSDCRKATGIDFHPNIASDEQTLTFLVRRSDGAAEKLKNIYSDEFTCSKGSIGSVAPTPLTTTELSMDNDNVMISGEGLSIVCKRKKGKEVMVNGQRFLKQDAAYVNIATSGTSFSINFVEKHEPPISDSEFKKLNLKIDDLTARLESEAHKNYNLTTDLNTKLNNWQSSSSSRIDGLNSRINVFEQPGIVIFTKSFSDCPSGWSKYVETVIGTKPEDAIRISANEGARRAQWNAGGYFGMHYNTCFKN